jgi:hypothetical protein
MKDKIRYGILTILAIGVLSIPFFMIKGEAQRSKTTDCDTRCRLIDAIKQAEGAYDCYCRTTSGHLIWFDNYGKLAPVVIEVGP